MIDGKERQVINIMGMEKYVAYVSTYTMGDKHGIKIFDVDMEKGTFLPKGEMEITNSSYISMSHNRKFLYAITDFGVEAFKILHDGMLESIHTVSINGMRGCYLSTDYTDSYLFVSSYHDAKVTVLRLGGDGMIGEITDEIYNKGLGSVAERNFRPHISCVKMSRDNRLLLAADLGMDHINVYSLNHKTGKLKLVEVIRSEIESAPRHIKFTKDGRFLYVIQELKNNIEVYEYKKLADHMGVLTNDVEFESIQTISTLNDYHAKYSAATSIEISYDHNYIVAANAGDNSVTVYRIDTNTGLLEKLFCLPISGDDPKDAVLFPDNKHLVSLNHESGTLTFFEVDIEKRQLIMCAKELKVASPNCIVFKAVEE